MSDFTDRLRNFFAPRPEEDPPNKEPEGTSFLPQKSDVAVDPPPVAPRVMPTRIPPEDIDEEIDKDRGPRFTQKVRPTKKQRRRMQKQARQRRRLNRIARWGR